MSEYRNANPWGDWHESIADGLASATDYLSRCQCSLAGEIAPDRFYFAEKGPVPSTQRPPRTHVRLPPMPCGRGCVPGATGDGRSEDDESRASKVAAAGVKASAVRRSSVTSLQTDGGSLTPRHSGALALESVTADQHDLIVRNPRVCHGQAVVKGTRIMVSIILEALADGMTEQDILTEYPTQSVEGIMAAAANGADLARDEFPAVASQ